MRITLKLYALLGRFLPPGARDNQVDLDVADGTTVAQVFRDNNVPAEHCHLVLVNGAYVAPSERDARALADGDVLAAWPPVAGGRGKA